MDIQTLQIKETDYTGLDVASAPDQLTGTAAENKAVFDRLAKELLAVRFNSLLEGLQDSGEHRHKAGQDPGLRFAVR